VDVTDIDHVLNDVQAISTKHTL